ncbi:MAG TPA: amidase [Nitrososphaerales archaeon]|nr:amidase [Nitrososphaerales archaeon]
MNWHLNVIMNLTLLRIASEIRCGQIDPDVLDLTLLERIGKYDAELYSYVKINPEALIQGGVKRTKTERRKILGCLSFAVKDLIDTKGIETTYGVPNIFRNHVPNRDARVVANIKRNGGFILGKTRTHQFALGLETPPTKNPWDRSRIPGGSSGGSAAAVASDLALCALGTDTGGSIRIPAAMCGVVGLKPTYGRISKVGVFPTSPSMDHVGPICRYVSDLPMLLQGMGYRLSVERWKPGTRIGIISEFIDKADSGIRSSIKKCISVLLSEKLVEAEEIEKLPMFPELCHATETIDTYEVAKIHKKRFLQNPKVYQRTASGLIKAGLSVKQSELIQARKEKRQAQKEYANLMKRYTVLLSPTLPCIAPRPEEISKYSSSDFLPLVRPLEIFDLLGYPALSVPCGFVNGMPVGVQLVSSLNLDSLIIALGMEYQRLTNWHKLVPERYRGFEKEIGM